MVDLSSAVQWWEEWQLRVLVLGSLILQFFLFFASIVRNFRMPSFFRLCIWLAYLGADALAIYALATLFNRHKLPAGDGRSSILEVLWAPVLLIHLGGQHSMTAYSIEDNDLWRRHLVTVVSQVTVALYVFCKSWPGSGDRRLLQAAILLFVVGILKFIWKPWVLKNASLSSVMTSSIVYPQRQKGKLQQICELLYLPYETAFTSSDDAIKMKKEEEHDISLEEFVQKARELIQVTEANDEHELRVPSDIEKLFVDLSAPYCRRLNNLQYFLKLSGIDPFRDLGADLSYAFGLVYTNSKGVLSLPGLLLFSLLPFLALSAPVLFISHHKDDYYQENDIKVTTILLWCTTLLEFLPFFVSPCVVGCLMWSIAIAQHNLISFYTREWKPTKLMKLSGIMGCKGYTNKHWYIEQTPESRCIEIIDLVINHVKDGWKLYIIDAASYKRFNNFRGRWTVGRHKLSSEQLLWSLQVPFDQSVLVWHIVTELCLHHPNTSSAVAIQVSTAGYSRIISNYMIYLLFIHPEMLMPGSRQGLFIAACDDIKHMLENASEPLLQNGTSIMQRILQMAQSGSIDVGTSIQRACRLAEDLMDMVGDEEERWKVIQGVWVEMLCCSASRCRGYLHAKSMGEGTEFLTIVWLLWSRMGMETFADKFQKPDPTEGGEVTAGASTSQPLEIPVLEEITIV
ncbi:hypothetical protein ACP70R_005860 [Stipagrostis hirtigluma subsp. patula]